MDMTATDLLPEVPSFEQRPRFYKDEKAGILMVEISYIGNRDTNIKKVTPEVMARYPTEWAAFCDGRPLEQRAGTPLTDLPEIHAELAKSYIERNVHNLEELAALSDAQCQGLGHGTLTLRGKAKDLVMQRWADQRTVTHSKIAEGQNAAKIDTARVEKLEQVVTDMAEQMKLLIAALQPKSPPPEPIDLPTFKRARDNDPDAAA